jgi:NAD/NADP transhydrogenase beta subunit
VIAELEDIDPEFALCFGIDASDVISPVTEDGPPSPIDGMPVLQA